MQKRGLLSVSHSKDLASLSIALFHHTGTQQPWRDQPELPTRGFLSGGNHRLSKSGSGRTFPRSYASHESWPGRSTLMFYLHGQVDPKKVELSGSPKRGGFPWFEDSHYGWPLTTSRKGAYRYNSGPFGLRSATEGGLVLILIQGLSSRYGSHEKIFLLNQMNQTL